MAEDHQSIRSSISRTRSSDWWRTSTHNYWLRPPVSRLLLRQQGVHTDAQHLENSIESRETPRPIESDLWTYQLPSKSTKPVSWTDFKPAAIKDTIRDKLGYKSGGYEWAEVEVQATEQTGHEGKVHPGPRAFFGVDVASDGRSVIIWGGDNAKNDKEADGWLIRFV